LSKDKHLDETISEIRKTLQSAPLPRPETELPVGFEYRPSLVSYFDVLGMKELLTAAGTDANKVANVLDIARRFSTPDRGASENFGWKFINFSDLVLRIVPILSDANQQVRLGLVFHELIDLAYIQVNLAGRGVLIRGALTIGRIAAEHGLVFGPALANAYILESKKAVFPRIIVDDKALTALREIPLLRAHNYKEEMGYIGGLIRQDSDGVWFVDYLGYLLENADDNYEYAEFLQVHKSLVNKQLSEARKLDGRTHEGKSRRQKAEWLKSYHNTHLQRVSAEKLKEETGIERRALFV
jgi:hypothetical protein